MNDVIIAAYEKNFKTPYIHNYQIFSVYRNTDNLICVRWTTELLNKEFRCLKKVVKDIKYKTVNKYKPFNKHWAFENDDECLKFLKSEEQKKCYNYDNSINLDEGILKSEFSDLVIKLFTINNSGYIICSDPKLVKHFKCQLWVSKEIKQDCWEESPIVYKDVQELKTSLITLGIKVEQEFLEAKSVKVIIDKWFVKIICTPEQEPFHYLLRLEDYKPLFYWTAPWPSGKKVPTPWNGVIYASRSEWNNKWRAILINYGIKWEEVTQNLSPKNLVSIDYSNLPRIETTLYRGLEQNKDCIEHICKMNGRAVIIDKTTIKTVTQAIVFSGGINMKRTLIVAPSSTHSLWEQRIKTIMGQKSKIQYLDNSKQEIYSTTNWLIITPDSLKIPTRVIGVKKQCDKQLINKSLKDADLKKLSWRRNSYQKNKWDTTISIEEIIDIQGLSEKVQIRWNNIKNDLMKAVTMQAIFWRPELIIFDDSNEIKLNLKQRQSLLKLGKLTRHLIFLTDINIISQPKDAIILLELLDNGIIKQINDIIGTDINPSIAKEKRKQYVKEFLNIFIYPSLS